MRILVAEDDLTSRKILINRLGKWGYEVVWAADGETAWKLLQEPDSPGLLLLDWIMPGLEGVEICRRIRASESPYLQAKYVILVTNRGREHIVEGLGSGADDYIVKPYDPGELQARIQTGLRVLALQEALAFRVNELQQVLEQVQLLAEVQPICSRCKKERDDPAYRQRVKWLATEYQGLLPCLNLCPDCQAWFDAQRAAPGEHWPVERT